MFISTKQTKYEVKNTLTWLNIYFNRSLFLLLIISLSYLEQSIFKNFHLFRNNFSFSVFHKSKFFICLIEMKSFSQKRKKKVRFVNQKHNLLD